MKIQHPQEGIPSTCLREISILKELDQENIVKLLDIEIIDRQETQELTIYLVFEWVDLDLKEYKSKLNDKAIPIDKVREIMWQMLKAL